MIEVTPDAGMTGKTGPIDVWQHPLIAIELMPGAGIIGKLNKALNVYGHWP
jgi:hypothetical protein